MLSPGISLHQVGEVELVDGSRETGVHVVDQLELKNGKTKDAISAMEKLGITSALFIDGAEVNESFGRAARNVIGVDVLPIQGANVYDILRRDTLVLTTAALEALEARLK